MAERLDPTPTPLSKLEVAVALARCWLALTGTFPFDTTVRLLVAQSALETGWWEHCRAYNMGNIKGAPSDGRDFAFFPCNEVLTWEQASRLIAGAPQRPDGEGKAAAVDHASTSARTARLGLDDGRVVVQFWPDHPAARFRAFRTLDDGMHDHLNFLRGQARFAAALAAAAAGDTAGFVRGLKAGGYFTADEAAYRATLDGVLKMLGPLPWREELERQAARAAYAVQVPITNEAPEGRC